MRVVAPSSPFLPERLERGVERLSAAGFLVEDVSDLLVGDHAYLNGNDEERARALKAALSSDADVVWVARGGYGLTRIVSRLSLPKGPLPVVVGFSDTTALAARLLALGARSVHGPLATTVADEPEASFEHLLRVLEGRVAGTALEALRPLWATPAESAVEGWLFGANLCVLGHLVGTSALPSFDGALLVLEEVGERPYRIDRILTQLLEAGALDGVRGVVLGHLIGCEEPGRGQARRPPSAEEVFAERLASLGVPLVAGAPVGHRPPNFAIPNGVRARLEWGPEKARLLFLEELYDGAFG